ncbi:MAG: Nif3-like dinuclear metal center hexameric protein [Oscillospiraceae bacterium]|nr:Nif3-like dinuclear metal center hexameric protein [Oscillospiraceae bacterium]
MATVADILKFIESVAPPYMKEDWDNVGLNCGHMDRPVTKILVALDPFPHVCREAKEVGADLLVTHHALIWKPGFITDANAQGRNTLFLIENGIAHINAHTNLDQAPGGVNDVLAAKLGLENVEIINPRDGFGLMRCGDVAEQPLARFLGTVKESLGCDGLRYVSGGKAVRKVAVGGGSCAGGMWEVLAAGCDTFVTADIKYNQFWDAKDLGLNLIDAGHFHTENPVVSVLAGKIAAAFPDVQVEISKTHRDCMKFY